MRHQQPGSIVAEVAMHDRARYDQYVEWCCPVLEKYRARPLSS